MITSPTGRQQITVHGMGPQSETMSLSQFRDAVGYSKQTPLPARELVIPGVVKMAGSTITVTMPGVLDGDKVIGLGNTDGLLGATVAGANIPDGTVVAAIPVPATPGQSGTVMLSNVGPFPPATGLPQPLSFRIVLRHSSIAGLSSTDGLAGARVAGPGIPDGTTVWDVSIPASPPTNMQPGVPGEVLLLTPVPPHGAPTPAAAPAADAAPAPRPAATTTPADITFRIPTAPIVIPDGVSRLHLRSADAIEALVVTLPADPVDGQVAFIYSTMAIAELTVLACPGQHLNWTPMPPPKDPPAPADVPWLALAADTSVGWLYSAPDKTWDRIQ
jgi:hypothetical protein